MKTLRTFLVCALLTFSTQSFAATATYLDNPTDDVIDITSMVPVTAPAGVKIFIFNATVGSNYTMQFSVDEQPEIVVTTGSRMIDDWSYDEATKTVTVQLNYTGFIQAIADEMFMGQQSFAVGFSWPDDSDSIPPLTGLWMSTNIFEWSIDDERTDRIGFEVKGPAGSTGYFVMNLPAAALTQLVPGRTLTVDDLALFNDGDQASVSVEETVSGGARINVTVRFASDSNIVTGLQALANGNESKSLTAGRKLPISLASNDYSVRKGSSFRLFGWLGKGTRGKAVEVQVRAPGKTTYAALSTVTSGAEGSFKKSLKLAKAGTYRFRARFRDGKTLRLSPVKTVVVR